MRRPSRRQLLSLVFLGSLLVPVPHLRGPDTSETHFRRASQMAQEGKIEGAIGEYRLGLKQAPSAHDAYNNLGVLYFQKQDYRQAIMVFQEADRLRPKDPEISFNLGLALLRAGSYKAAIPYLALGVGFQSHSLDAHYLLGLSHYQLKEWQLALQELEFVRQNRPNDEVLYLLVTAYRKSGQPQKSMEAFAQLLRTNPDSPFVHELVGLAHDAANEARQAEEEFRKALAVSPALAELHFALGYLYWRRGQLEDAITPFEQEIEINPNSAESNFYLGDIALKQQRTEQAVSYFKNTLKLNPGYGEACLGLGQAYVQLGRTQASIELFRKAAQLLPDNVEPQYWLGKTLIKLGQKPEGQRILEKVEEIHSTQHKTDRDRLGRGASPAAVKKE